MRLSSEHSNYSGRKLKYTVRDLFPNPGEGQRWGWAGDSQIQIVRRGDARRAGMGWGAHFGPCLWFVFEILPNPSQQKAADEPRLCRNPPHRQELFVLDCKVSVQQEQFREGMLFFGSATRALNLSEFQAGTESCPAASGKQEAGGLATLLRTQGSGRGSCRRSSALL